MPNTPCMFLRCNVAISVARLEVNPASASSKCSSKFWGHPQKELKTCFVFFFCLAPFGCRNSGSRCFPKRPAQACNGPPPRCQHTVFCNHRKVLSRNRSDVECHVQQAAKAFQKHFGCRNAGIYQTSAAVFRCNCFLQHLASLQSIDQRAQKKINKIRRFFLFFNFLNDVQHRRFVCCIAELLLGTNRTEQGNGMICYG